ncbi:MAG: MazG nucleotide pyrophosphohydrolase domain-containing protein, partial [Paracoccaceae bacterium]
LDKLIEEAQELTEAVAKGNSSDIEEEYGDLLFTFVNLGRHLNIEPEVALKRTNNKFKERFEFIEIELANNGKSPRESSLEEMDGLWEKAKESIK